MSEFLVVYITASGDNAKDLASALVREKLAACVNRVPGVESTYIWEGRVERDTEDLLIVKTRTDLFDRLKQRVQTLHDYDVPEIIGVPIDQGSESYLEWMTASMSKD
ncbi:MAG: divalent-cation tolerance protein CutA [Deltaproteobacteria bacterium]|nr:divalent-cation tolerance protein CutA [Deltaproteobacteria bacterium]